MYRPAGVAEQGGGAGGAGVGGGGGAGEADEAPALDLCADKDACVLELDEAEDVTTTPI